MQEHVVPIRFEQNANQASTHAAPYQNFAPQFNRVQAPLSSQTYPGNQRGKQIAYSEKN